MGLDVTLHLRATGGTEGAHRPKVVPCRHTASQQHSTDLTKHEPQNKLAGRQELNGASEPAPPLTPWE